MRAATSAGTASRTTAKQPCGFERPSVVQQAGGARGRPALRVVAAQHRRGLWRQPEMTHHGHAGGHDGGGAPNGRARAFHLDGIGTGVADEPDRVRHGNPVRDLVGTEGEIGNEQRPPGTARDGAGQHQHLVHRDADRGVEAEDRHRGGVAHEDGVDAGAIGQPRARRVVGGQHRDLATAPGCVGERAGKHFRRAVHIGRSEASSMSSSGRLSINRVRPTRAATTSARMPFRVATAT